MSWYDLNEKEESITQYKSRVRYDAIISAKASSFKDIANAELEKNVQYRFVTNNHFNTITVIQFLFEKYKIESISIAIYRMNQKSVDKLIEFIEITKMDVKILLSNFFRENKRYEKWCETLINYSQGKKNVVVGFGLNHAKVFIARTKCNRHIVFEGSGNLSDNARIEQYLIEDCKTTYDFHNQWISKFLTDGIY
jgi:hypothetical protein